MNYYVVGYLFSTERDLVVLILKTHPAEYLGVWNGVGGRLERGEDGLQAMSREFLEETGVEVSDWEGFCTLVNPSSTIYVYRAFSAFTNQCEPQGEEGVQCHSVSILPQKCTPDTKWLIPMALGMDDDPAKRFVVERIFP